MEHGTTNYLKGVQHVWQEIANTYKKINNMPCVCRIRGALGSYLMVFVSFGILVSFVAGTYLPYASVPYVFIFLPVLYVLGVLWLPDTCPQLLGASRLAEAERSFVFYRLGNRRLAADAEGGAAQQKFVTDELQQLQLFLKTRASNDASMKLWETLCKLFAGTKISLRLSLTDLTFGVQALRPPSRAS